MAKLYQCRRCHGPPVPTPWEGACPHCLGFYRPIPITAGPPDVAGAELTVPKDGEVISAKTLLASLEGDSSLGKRPTGMAGVDWLFAGGLPFFGVILLCGGEGCGKSTWLWELFAAVGEAGVSSLLISSEQSLEDLGREFARCTPPPECMHLVSETNKESIFEKILEYDPEIVAIDSIHDVENVTDEQENLLTSGNQAAVTRLAKELKRLAPRWKKLIFLVGHMNNDGSLAGGAHLRHACDATLVLSRSDDEADPRRILQFKGKTRFGRLGRRALFEMADTGLKDCGAVEEKSPAPRRSLPN